MKPAPFDYHRATSVNDAVLALTEAERSGVDAKVIAGGQSLVPLLALRLAQPSVLVDLQNVGELGTVDWTAADDQRLMVGAMTRHAEVASQAGHPLLAAASAHIGHTAIRTRGTVGGSLAHADPNAELPAVALACDGLISSAGPAPGGEVVVAQTTAAEFFLGPLQTSLGESDLLTAVSLERPRRWGFAELARRHGDFALVLAVVCELSSGWRVVLGGVGSTPVRCPEAEAALEARVVPAEVGQAAVASVEGYDDLHASARYRVAMAAEMVARATGQARAEPAGGGR